jgi:phage terminase large subunit GpA-like protein
VSELTLQERSRISALRAASRGLRIPERLTPSAWAAKHRRLSSRASAIPGPWNPDRIPFLNAIMDALDPQHPARQVTFAKSSQVGGSEAGLNWLGWVVDQAPGPMLVLMPTEKLGLRWVRGRLRPMILESRVLAGKIRLGRQSKSGGGTLNELHFSGGVIYLGSANVPSDLSSVPAQYLLLDEVDRMPRLIDGEGNPIELAKRRIATYQGRSKIFEISTPTDDGSPIDADYQASSRGRYWVPCPECGEHQVLRWGQLTWPQGRPREARYACEHCGALIDEAHKGAMLAAGQWRHERPELVDEHIGFHVNCLYTPPGLGDSWGQNAVEWEWALQDPAKKQVFVNTRLGEVHREGKVRLDWEVLRGRAEPYPLRTIPPGVLALTCGIDLQVDRAEAQILGWSRGERATVIDYHVIPGDPAGEDLYRAIDEYLALRIRNSFGVEMGIACALVDAGNWQHQVLSFTRTLRARNIYASRGSPVLTKPAIGKPAYPDVRVRGALDKRGARLYWLGVSELKKLIFARLKADGTEADEAAATPAGRYVRFSDELPDEYYRQVVAEVFDTTLKKWLPTRERNEALDTMVYAFAAAMHHAVGIHRWRDADWDRMEQLYEPKGGAKPVADVTAPAAPHGVSLDAVRAMVPRVKPT